MMTIVDSVHELAHEILTDMGLDLDVLDPSEFPHEGILTASIAIDGAWSGLVSLGVPERFTRAFSARWLGLTEDDVSEEMSLDSLGELMNMMGGHFKARFCGQGELGLPVVARDEAVSELREEMGEAVVAHFICEGFPIRFSVSVRVA